MTRHLNKIGGAARNPFPEIQREEAAGGPRNPQTDTTKSRRRPLEIVCYGFSEVLFKHASTQEFSESTQLMMIDIMESLSATSVQSLACQGDLRHCVFSNTSHNKLRHRGYADTFEYPTNQYRVNREAWFQ